jgi:hypothetical protein
VVDPETVRKVCLYRPVARAVSPATEGFAEHLAAWLPAWSRKVLRGGGPPARAARRQA